MSEQFTSHNDTNHNDQEQDTVSLSSDQEPTTTTTDSDHEIDITTVGATLEGSYLGSNRKLAIDSPYFRGLLGIEDEAESDSSDKQA